MGPFRNTTFSSTNRSPSVILRFYTFIQFFLFFFKCDFSFKNFFQGNWIYCIFKKNNPMATVPTSSLAPPTGGQFSLQAGYFSVKFLLMARKRREAGEERQHRSHCVVIRDQDSLHTPTSLDKKPGTASTRCCNGATGDAQPFKERAR